MDSASFSSDCQILVTGSNGFVGSRVVQKLLQSGYFKLRCFVRQFSRLERLKEVLGRIPGGENVELVVGDLLCREDCERATAGISIIYHLAAGMEKSFAGAFMNSVLATRNLMDAFMEFGRPKRMVSISSFAVYSTLHLKRRTVLDEVSPIENTPQERFDAYGFGKLKQEELVREYGEKHKLPYVILRPGYVFGPGKTELSGRIGIDTFGVFIRVGGSHFLPLTYVDNCAEAIMLAGLKPGIKGEVFNVVDDELLTSSQFLKAYNRRVGRFCLWIPYSVACILCILWEKYSTWSKGQLPPAFNRRRCAAEWKPMRYSNTKLKERVGWKPRVPMNQAMELFLEQFNQNHG